MQVRTIFIKTYILAYYNAYEKKMKLINSRFIGCTYCFPRSAARFQLTSSRWRACEKNNDDESKRGEGVEKGKAVTTRILQSQGRRGRSRQGWQFSGASHPLPVSTKYTVHRACNVPLSVDPTGLLHARTYTHVQIHGYTNAEHALALSGGLPYDL